MTMRMIRSATLAALLLGVFAAAPAMAQQGPAPIKIGVVNTAKVFNSIQETVDIRAKLDADATGLKTLAQAHQSELANIHQQMDNGLKQDTPQYDDLAQQFEQKSVQYENELKLKQIELQRGQARQLRLIFEKIEATVQDIAKEKGLDLVITEVRPEFPKNVRDLTPEAISQLVTSRNLLYVSDKINITSEVITALDAKYKSGGK